MEYAKADVLDNFNFFWQSIEVGFELDTYGVNQNTLRSTKIVWDEDSMEKVTYFAKSRSRSEDEEGANVSRKLDSTLPRLEGDI